MAHLARQRVALIHFAIQASPALAIGFVAYMTFRGLF